MLIFALLAAALAASGDDPRNAVLVNPIGPTLAVVSTAIRLPVIDFNLRGHHLFSDRWGLTVQADVTSLRIPLTVPSRYFGVRGGPRFAFRGRGLRDWNLVPFVMAGVTEFPSPEGRLARFGVLGAGVEAGRTWVWGRFAFELAVGTYSTVNVAYTARAESLEDSRPPSVLPIKPLVHMGLGYAW